MNIHGQVTFRLSTANMYYQTTNNIRFPLNRPVFRHQKATSLEILGNPVWRGPRLTGSTPPGRPLHVKIFPTEVHDIEDTANRTKHPRRRHYFFRLSTSKSKAWETPFPPNVHYKFELHQQTTPGNSTEKRALQNLRKKGITSHQE